MATTPRDPIPADDDGRPATPGARPGAGDAWEAIEMQVATLVRNLELLRRRGASYGPLDQSSYLLLRTLETIGPADINTLATAVGLDPSTAGRQLGDMQRKGLIDRSPAPSDRRRGVITPTPEGHRHVEHVRRLRRETTARLLAGWTDEELCTLGESFTRFNQAITAQYLGLRDGSLPDEGPPDGRPRDEAPTDGAPATERSDRDDSRHEAR